MSEIEKKIIFCTGCDKKAETLLKTGEHIYPHRPDLYDMYFWQCVVCGLYVGCHPNSKRPLGVLANKALKDARHHIHSLLDPIWKNGIIRRKILYNKISEKVGWQYHTANIRSLEEAHQVYQIIQTIKKEASHERD